MILDFLEDLFDDTDYELENQLTETLDRIKKLQTAYKNKSAQLKSIYTKISSATKKLNASIGVIREKQDVLKEICTSQSADSLLGKQLKEVSSWNPAKMEITDISKLSECNIPDFTPPQMDFYDVMDEGVNNAVAFLMGGPLGVLIYNSWGSGHSTSDLALAQNNYKNVLKYTRQINLRICEAKKTLGALRTKQKVCDQILKCISDNRKETA